MYRNLWRFFPVLACALVAAGCGRGGGGGKAEVAGTITFQGKPPGAVGIQSLEIAFLSRDGTVVTAPVGADGTYTAAEVPVGQVQVGLIWTPGKKGPRRGPPMPVGGSAPQDPAPTGKPENPVQPPSLQDPSTSKLTCTVEAGKANAFNYDVKP